MIKRWSSIGGPILALAAAPLFVNCGAMPGGLPGVPGAGCSVDIANPEAIMSASFGLSADIEGKLKAGLAAGANLQKLAAQIEGDVVTACSGLAMDLGASEGDLKPKEDGPGKKAEAACNVAVKLIGEVKAKAKGKITVDVTPPKCSASMDAMAECAGKCDVNVKPGEAKVSCEGGEISGKCSADCKGTCTVDAGAECTGSCGGECSGSCDASFSGTCGGTCDGKCDGTATKAGGAKCAGKCDGKCDANAKGNCGGSCKGKCSASCTVKGQAKCSGSCSGECSVKMEAPKCSGTVKPPEMSGECKANCDAELNAKVECQPAGVKVKVEGAADAKAAEQLVAAFQKNLPLLLKVTIGMKARLEGVMASVQASVEGLSAVVKGGGAAALKVAGCVTGAVTAQAQASMSINVSVKASASASGSASAG
jgi:hypothetical protein